MTATQQTRINGINVADVERLISTVEQNPAAGKAGFCVSTQWRGGAKTETLVSHWSLGGQTKRHNFTIRTDEPRELAGTDSQPNPQEVLMAGLNACMMVGYAALCSLKGITLDSIEIETEGELDLRGFLGLDPSVKPGYTELHYTVRIKGDGTPEQFREIHEIVQKTSPNFSNLATPVKLVPKFIVL